jgi:hypothetical protein
MTTLTFDADDEQMAALLELAMMQATPQTAQDYFVTRTLHWMTALIEARRERLRVTYGAEAAMVYEKATPEERAVMDALREKYRGTP